MTTVSADIVDDVDSPSWSELSIAWKSLGARTWGSLFSLNYSIEHTESVTVTDKQVSNVSVVLSESVECDIQESVPSIDIVLLESVSVEGADVDNIDIDVMLVHTSNVITASDKGTVGYIGTHSESLQVDETTRVNVTVVESMDIVASDSHAITWNPVIKYTETLTVSDINIVDVSVEYEEHISALDIHVESMDSVIQDIYIYGKHFDQTLITNTVTSTVTSTVTNTVTNTIDNTEETITDETEVTNTETSTVIDSSDFETFWLNTDSKISIPKSPAGFASFVTLETQSVKSDEVIITAHASTREGVIARFDSMVIQAEAANLAKQGRSKFRAMEGKETTFIKQELFGMNFLSNEVSLIAHIVTMTRYIDGSQFGQSTDFSNMRLIYYLFGDSYKLSAKHARGEHMVDDDVDDDDKVAGLADEPLTTGFSFYVQYPADFIEPTEPYSDTFEISWSVSGY